MRFCSTNWLLFKSTQGHASCNVYVRNFDRYEFGDTEVAPKHELLLNKLDSILKYKSSYSAAALGST
jgi:hypothetical protein